MNIVFATDDRYATYLAVAICSICDNNQRDKLVFYVIAGNGLSSDKEKLICDIVDRYKQTVVFCSVDEGLFKDFPLTKNSSLGHISMATYYRLYLPSILSADIDKVLYLDCDIICRGSLSDLYNYDLSNKAVGVIPDMDEANLSIYRRLRYPTSLGYFNAGVMLVNLKYWRDNSLTEQFIDFIRNYPERMLYNDQDVMNFVLRDRKEVLPIKYNVQEAALYERVNISWEYDEQLEEALKNPVIIHYTTSPKPWNTVCRHPWRNVWIEYLRLAKIGNFEFIRIAKPKISLYCRIRKMLVSIGLLEPLYKYRKSL